MTSSLEVTDQESAAVAVAPRVTLDEIEAAIKHRFDITGLEAIDNWLRQPLKESEEPFVEGQQLEILSICILIMQNGFTIIGKAAPASPKNFNRELGIKFAYEDAVRQLWPLMGFSLRDQLHKGTY